MAAAGCVYYDVIVLGAGPAGCAAAIRCAQAGLSAALVERSAFPRHRPGETLHPGVEPILAQLGVVDQVLAAGFLRHEGNWVRWGGGDEAAWRFEPFGGGGGAWRGFQACRETFDALLLARAREVGVVVHQPCPAVAPIFNGGGRRVAGITTSLGPMRTAHVIDATGAGRWLTRALRLSVHRHSPRLIARYGYARGRCPQRDDAPAIAADPAGWTWTARVADGLYQWTRLSFVPQRLPRDWRPAEFAGLAPDGPTRSADVTWRIAAEPAGPGYYLVGDAAATLDPAASHGVLKGLMSGMMAAHLIEQAAGHPQREAVAAVAYNRWLGDWFHADVARLRQLYAVLGAYTGVAQSGDGLGGSSGGAGAGPGANPTSKV